MIFLEMV